MEQTLDGTKIKANNVSMLGLFGNPAKQPPKAVDFVEEARFAKDDFGNWRVSYDYDPAGPTWRLDDPDTSHDSM